MSDGIQERDVESYGDEDLEYNARLGLFARIPASTTHRRVGRSTKTPPGPSLDDAAEGDASDGTGAAQDEVGAVLMSRLDDLLQTPVGLMRFFQALDGQSGTKRNGEDHRALNRTMKDLIQHNTLSLHVRVMSHDVCEPAPIAAAAQGDTCTQRAQVRIENGVRVLWLSDTLIAEEIVDEVIQFLSDGIELTAMENAVCVDRGGTARLLRDLYRHTV